MNQKRVLKGILTALICLTAPIPAYAEDTQAPQVIDFAGGIEAIDKLDLNTDPTLMSSMTTDWEVALESPEDANHNGHALLYHDGKLYVYTDRYVSGKDNPLIRAYNANDGSYIEEKYIPFSTIDELWNVTSLQNHLIVVDENGDFLFVFSDNKKTTSLKLVSYSFESNTPSVLQTLNVADDLNYNYNFSNSSLSFSKGILAGKISGDFSLSFNLLVDKYKQNSTNSLDGKYTIPILIQSVDGHTTAQRLKANAPTLQAFHSYGPTFPINRSIDLCEIDEGHLLASHDPASFEPQGEIGKYTLFDNTNPNKGLFLLKENWADENLMPAIGDYCLGMYVVKHDGHNVLVYAKSYVDNCLYNVVLWDDPSSFANMKLLGQIKVQGKISVSNIYKEGIRQMVVQEPKAVAPSEPSSAPRTYPTKDYYEHTTFYTYAPGAALARHSIVTEEDKIYTALTEISAESPLRLNGKTLHGCEYSPIAIHTPSGSLVAEYPAAAAIDLSLLPSGIYIIKSGKSAIKAAL